MELLNLNSFGDNDKSLLNTLLWLEEKGVEFQESRHQEEIQYIKKIYHKFTEYTEEIPLLYLVTYQNEYIYKLKRIKKGLFWYGISDRREYVTKIIAAIKKEGKNKILLNESLLNNNWSILKDDKFKIELEFTLNKNDILKNSKINKTEIANIWSQETKFEIYLHNGKIPYLKTFLGYNVSDKIEKSVDFEEFDNKITVNKENWQEHFEKWNKDLRQKFLSIEYAIKLRDFFLNKPNSHFDTKFISLIHKEHLIRYVLNALKNNDSFVFQANIHSEKLKEIYRVINDKIDNLPKESQYPLLYARFQDNTLIYTFDNWDISFNNGLVFYWNVDLELNTIRKLFEIASSKNIQFVNKICSICFRHGLGEEKCQIVDIKADRRVYYEKCLKDDNGQYLTWDFAYYQNWSFKDLYPIRFFENKIYYIDRFFKEDVGEPYDEGDEVYFNKIIFLNKSIFSEDYQIQSYLKQKATHEHFNNFVEQKGETDEKVKKVLDAANRNNQSIDNLAHLLSLGKSLEEIIELIQKEQNSPPEPERDPDLPKKLKELGKKGEKYVYEQIILKDDKFKNENIDWANLTADLLGEWGKVSPKENRDPYDIKIEIQNSSGDNITYFIECKATTFSEPVFYLTKNEWNLYLRTLKSNGREKYILYRIYNLQNYDINDNYSIVNAKCIKYNDIIESLKEHELLPYLPRQRQIGAETMFFQVNNY